MGEKIDIRNYNELSKSLTLAQHTVYKRYLQELDTYPIIQPSQILLDETPENCIRLIHLKELAYKKGEDVLQKLTTIYHSCMSLGCSLVVIVDVEKINAPAKIYIGVKNGGTDTEKNDLETSFETLKSGLKSNFPGTKYSDVPSKTELPNKIEEIFGDSVEHITSASCVAAVRNKSKTEEKSFIQGIERLIDAMHGNTYTAVFIAKPVSTQDQALIRSGYENIYSTLSSFRKSTWIYNANESRSVMESLSESVSESVTTGTSHTQAHTTSKGINIGGNLSKSEGTAASHTVSRGTSEPTKKAKVGKAISGVGSTLGLVGTVLCPFAGPAIAATAAAIGVAASALGGAMSGSSTSTSVTDAIVNSIGRSMGINGGLTVGISNTSADTTSESETHTEGKTTTKSDTHTEGTGKSLQIENINKPIDDMLERIDALLKRTQECEDYGAYNCAAYFVSAKKKSCMLGANTFRALMIGEGSSIETGAINYWSSNSDEEKEKVKAIKEYIKRFEHPVFALSMSEDIPTREEDFIKYTAGTIVSGAELPLHIGLPTRSVLGLPVIEHAEFGKEVSKYAENEDSRECQLGYVFGFENTTNTAVNIDVDSLTMHTFITGSTGSGKSNTIYVLLNELKKNFNIPFLVIEPAKGEYKNIFGQLDDVSVYGTNPKKTDLLRINPFSFPAGVHILEHIDRLVEIFNVCWPMYAAMPAIMKKAMEKAYTAAGWDLFTSENKRGKIYPGFSDLLEQIEAVINASKYSMDSKGDYSGALLTRVSSLTTGLNGVIFSGEEISNKDLFEKNVVIDLSRVGSTETKALIMGILVMKLNEYRMDEEIINSPLRHITVLEEAHTLLKKTSVVQSEDSPNLIGKSVEMLSNSIAEMRTYGEGFVIADQSPGLLDLSVIRNTNTKIILKLPEKEDRELVGYASGLSENQISELAKLKKGVAAIYQNDWVEPVLVQINKSELKERPYEYDNKNNVVLNNNALDVTDFLTLVLKEDSKIEINNEKKKKLTHWIDNLNIVNSSKRMLKKALADSKLTESEKKELCYNAFSGKKIADTLLEAFDKAEAIKQADEMIADELNIKKAELIEIIRNNIIEKAGEIPIASDLPNRYKFFIGGKK